MKTRNEEIEEHDQEAVVTGSTANRVEIHVRGQLDESWSDWLDGLHVSLLDNGEMVLTGQIGDQAALMGVLNRLYGLNLAILSVNEIKNQ